MTPEQYLLTALGLFLVASLLFLALSLARMSSYNTQDDDTMPLPEKEVSDAELERKLRRIARGEAKWNARITSDMLDDLREDDEE